MSGKNNTWFLYNTVNLIISKTLNIPSWINNKGYTKDADRRKNKSLKDSSYEHDIYCRLKKCTYGKTNHSCQLGLADKCDAIKRLIFKKS